MSNEQWKTDGDCSKCRRKSYCSHECKAHEKAVIREVYGLVADHMEKKMRG